MTAVIDGVGDDAGGRTPLDPVDHLQQGDDLLEFHRLRGCVQVTVMLAVARAERRIVALLLAEERVGLLDDGDPERVLPPEPGILQLPFDAIHRSASTRMHAGAFRLDEADSRSRRRVGHQPAHEVGMRVGARRQWRQEC